MRQLPCILCLCAMASLCFALPVEAKGGKGGGGRPSWAGGGMKSGGPKISAGRPAHAGGNHQLADARTAKPVKDKDQFKQHSKEQKELKQHKEHKKVRDSQQVSTDDDLGDDDVADDPTEVLHPKQKQLLNEQRNRDKRIAQAQRLREIAERTGNQNLAANADRMEAFAHEHYANRLAHWEKFGPIDPSFYPDGGLIDPQLPGGGVIDPQLPGGDPLGDVLDALLPILP